MMPARWSHLVRNGLLGTTLLAAAGSPARAERCDDIADRTIGFVIGVQVSPDVRIVGGFEARYCTTSNTEAMLRLELGGGPARLIAGMRVRPFERTDDESDAESIGAEAAGVLDMHANFGVHLAATYGTHSAYLAAQGLFPVTHREQLQDRVSILMGLAPWTLSRGATTVEGRPLVADGRLMRPDVTYLPGARTREDRAVRDHFVSSAQIELSSVWTFLRLANELAAVGAPAELIAAALDAADDEVRHAELCARAAGGAALAKLADELARPRFTARTPHALARLAAEAWCEGCLNETAAAEEARIAASFTSGARRQMLETIARDETRHAELSWSVLAWIVSVAPELAHSTLASLPAYAVASDDHRPFDAALVRHGVPSPAISEAARAHAASHADARLRELAA